MASPRPFARFVQRVLANPTPAPTAPPTTMPGTIPGPPLTAAPTAPPAAAPRAAPLIPAHPPSAATPIRQTIVIPNRRMLVSRGGTALPTAPRAVLIPRRRARSPLP